MMKRHELTQIDYQELFLMANVTYQTLVDSAKCLLMPPNDMALMMLMAKVDKLQCLVQCKEPVSSINKEKKKCFKCDKEGHWARDCPEKKQDDDKKKVILWKGIAPKANKLQEKL